ncbi:hypothetical protein [Paenibacillus sp. JDR-2]|uniref:hypothetical protein n=1 Tax=Paenibacillus sp. (strain JDR-2) TaxID=324057 RepID=UPI0001664A22|nr:hypothetical protein [Paenibacillus sp. JDR-2]ACT04194.1 hypothetical protein Pjdr2_5586 [Paenibacillus sp. JDR-2]
MKMRQIWVSAVILLLLAASFYFLNTRVWVDKYEIRGDTIVFEDNRYAYEGSSADHLGKTIGIAYTEGRKRGITDYIWPEWVYAYKGDKAHKRIFVRGLMDMGDTYIRQQ